VPLTGGATAVYNSSGLVYYRHSDHLGSSRFASTPTRTLYFDGAYGPFGEPYATSGTTDLSFTGMNQDTVANLYDFPAREYGTQGRWPSPDPAGILSVRTTDPQSWNRYAYTRNSPLTHIDPTGMGDSSGQDNPTDSGGPGGPGDPDNPDPEDPGNPNDCPPGAVCADPQNQCNDANCQTDTTCNDNGCVNTTSVTVNGNDPSMVAPSDANTCAPGDFICNAELQLLTMVYKPWVLNFNVPIAYGIGPAGVVEYNPLTNTTCLGLGIGLSAGKNVSIGPLTNGKMFNGQSFPNGADNLLSGGSFSGGAISPAFFGAQGMVNGAGAAGGPAVGYPGFSAAATYSVCN